MKTKQQKIRVGVLGGGPRGFNLAALIAQYPEVALAAVCDLSEPFLKKCREMAKQNGKGLTVYRDFDRFLNHDLDAVIVSNYATEHAPYAVRALESGRHVCSEVVACQNLAEAVELVEAVERSGKVYAFAENCCYSRGALEMQRLYRAGKIGEFLHAEGEYVHDCEIGWETRTGGLRNHWRNWAPATFYCTHSIGPIITITGTRPTRVTAYETPNIVKRRFGCRSADGAVILCQMSNGGTMKVLPWCNFRRSPSLAWYCVYGTKGMMETDRWGSMTERLHVYRHNDRRSAQDLSYKPRFPYSTELSLRTHTHGGADFYTLHAFLQKILGRPQGRNAVDVYQALDMTLPGLLGYRSIVNGNIPVDIPDFRKAAAREKYRNDRWCCDPKLAGPGQPEYSWSGGEVKVPASIYRKQQKMARR